MPIILKRSEETLGFCFKDLSEGCIVLNHLGFDEPFYYCKNLFETVLNAQVVNFNENPEEQKRSVQIDDMNIMATDFDITPHQIESLYHNGYHSTVCFLEGEHSRIKDTLASVRSSSTLDCICQPCQICPPCPQVSPGK